MRKTQRDTVIRFIPPSSNHSWLRRKTASSHPNFQWSFSSSPQRQAWFLCSLPCNGRDQIQSTGPAYLAVAFCSLKFLKTHVGGWGGRQKKDTRKEMPDRGKSICRVWWSEITYRKYSCCSQFWLSTVIKPDICSVWAGCQQLPPANNFLSLYRSQ